MILEFDHLLHVYKINGTMVPGVTTVTSCLPKPWGMAWSVKEMGIYINARLEEFPALQIDRSIVAQWVVDGKKAYKTKADTAAEKGTSAHDFFEQYVKLKISKGNGPPIEMPTDPEVRNSVELFLRWEMACQPKWVASEQIVGSLMWMYGGKFDAIAILDGKMTLIDFKTSNGIYEDYYIQLAAYQEAHNSMSENTIDQRMILWTPKTGKKFEARIVPTDYENDKTAFLSALTIYRWLNQFKTNGTK